MTGRISLDLQHCFLMNNWYDSMVTHIIGQIHYLPWTLIKCMAPLTHYSLIDAKNCAPSPLFKTPVILCFSFPQSTTHSLLHSYVTFCLLQFAYSGHGPALTEVLYIQSSKRLLSKIQWPVCKPHTHNLVLFFNDCTFVRNILVQLINLQGLLLCLVCCHSVKSFKSVFLCLNKMWTCIS